jgi:hypothetical protein
MYKKFKDTIDRIKRGEAVTADDMSSLSTMANNIRMSNEFNEAKKAAIKQTGKPAISLSIAELRNIEGTVFNNLVARVLQIFKK